MDARIHQTTRLPKELLRLVIEYDDIKALAREERKLLISHFDDKHDHRLQDMVDKIKLVEDHALVYSMFYLRQYSIAFDSLLTREPNFYTIWMYKSTDGNTKIDFGHRELLFNSCNNCHHTIFRGFCYYEYAKQKSPRVHIPTCPDGYYAEVEYYPYDNTFTVCEQCKDYCGCASKGAVNPNFLHECAYCNQHKCARCEFTDDPRIPDMCIDCKETFELGRKLKRIIARPPSTYKAFIKALQRK